MIPETLIMDHLEMLRTGSEPGAMLHHLHVVGAPEAAVGPLGLPDPERLHTTVYAIAADGPGDVDAQLLQVIARAGAEEQAGGRLALFAAISQEVWAVHPMDAHAWELRRAQRLQEHPGAFEATLVYAACRDGRRWRARQTLTGPQAGTASEVELVVGAPLPWEGVRGWRMMRAMVGQR